MSNIPKMAHVIPIRSRLQFTTNALPSILLHASREHEVVLVIDKCPLEYELMRRPDVYPNAEVFPRILADRTAREKVYRWIDAHTQLLSDHKIRVVEFLGDKRHWTGGLRAAAAMNMGVASTTSDWIVGFGDEDLVFMRGWDAALWETVRGRDPMRFVGTTVMVVLAARDPIPMTLTPGWVHGQRALACSHLSFPVAAGRMEPSVARVAYESLQRFYDVGRMAGVHEEPCGLRRMCHWVPLLMHRRLFERVGGYPTSDRAHSSYDLVLDDSLGGLGVMKRMPHDSMTFHFKHYLRLSDEVDKTWGDAETLGSIREVV